MLHIHTQTTPRLPALLILLLIFFIQLRVVNSFIFLPPNKNWDQDLNLSRIGGGGGKGRETHSLSKDEEWRSFLFTSSTVNEAQFEANLSPDLSLVERSKHLLGRHMLHHFPGTVLTGSYVRNAIIQNMKKTKQLLGNWLFKKMVTEISPE
jgi:hypothetical protein